MSNDSERGDSAQFLKDSKAMDDFTECVKAASEKYDVSVIGSSKVGGCHSVYAYNISTTEMCRGNKDIDVLISG